MLVWLKMPIYAPFGVLGHIPPNDATHRPNPQKDHPWAEPRHLSHKPRVFSYRYLNGPYKRPLFPIGLTLRGSKNGFFGVLNMVG